MEIKTKLNLVWVGVGVVVIALLGWLLFFRDTTSGIPTITVHRGDFTAHVNVTGSITAAQSVDLGFAQNGRIARILVKVGDTVQQGDTIAVLENSDLQSTVAQKQAALAQAQAQLKSLQEGTRPEQIAVLQSSVSAAQTALDQADAALVDAIQAAYTAADDAVHNKADQFFANPRTDAPTVVFSSSNSQAITTVQSERASLEPMFAAWKSEVSDLSSTHDLDVAIMDAQVNVSAVNKFLVDANTALSGAIPNQTASATAISGYVTSVAAARSATDSARTALTNATTAQKDAAAALDTAQRNLTLAQAGSTDTAVAAQQALVDAARADLGAAEGQLAKTTITAPFSGTITHMDAKVGEVVSPTTHDISIMSEGAFQIEAYISEINIASVAVGDAATTTLDALGSQVMFGATVVSIDPGATVQGGVPTYKTIMQLSGDDARIRSGMTAGVSIAVRQDHDVIVVPQSAIFMKDAQQMVQVRKDDSIIDQAVTAMPADSLGLSEITSGLGDGDQ
ncbi:MAG TPA: efflux RND transporter periplasmic adaptor subunit, partial [Candidatus Paceibacterota bacterium]